MTSRIAASSGNAANGGTLDLPWNQVFQARACIYKPAPSMGDFLRQWLGADYRAVAVTFASGSVLVARDGEDLCAAPLPPPRRGSLDAALAAPGLALADLRGDVHPALRRPQRMRGFSGVRARDRRLRPAIAFDAILNLPRVEAAIPLGAGAHAAMYMSGPCYRIDPAP